MWWLLLLQFLLLLLLVFVAADIVLVITTTLLHLHQSRRFQVTWSWRFFRSPGESPRSAGAQVAHHPAPKRSKKASSNSNDNETNRVNAMAMGGAVDINFLTWITNNLVDPCLFSNTKAFPSPEDNHCPWLKEVDKQLCSWTWNWSNEPSWKGRYRAWKDLHKKAPWTLQVYQET